MGIDTYYYKKVKSFSKNELNNILENILSKESSSFVYVTPKTDYVERMLELDSLDLLVPATGEENEYIQGVKKNYEDYWEKSQDNVKILSEKTKQYVDNPDATTDDFIEILKSFSAPYSGYLKYYDRECYVEYYAVPNMRCYKYSDEYICTYDEMLEFLQNCPDGAVEYMEDNEKGLFNIIKGKSAKLYNHLKELYKDNDVIVSFH